MKTIGLTGGIGSGKSTIARVFETLGVPVFYSDTVAKQAYQQAHIQAQVINAFGEESYVEGKINRAFLASIVFSDAEKLRQLEAIIHPYVAQEWKTFAQLHRHKAYAVKEAAILFETNGHTTCDAVITVAAPEDERINRVMKRDGTTAESVRERMQRQWTDPQRAALATYVLENTNQERVLEKILRMDNFFRS
jgi:dephospho-CoA kinase